MRDGTDLEKEFLTMCLNFFENEKIDLDTAIIFCAAAAIAIFKVEKVPEDEVNAFFDSCKSIFPVIGKNI